MDSVDYPGLYLGSWVYMNIYLSNLLFLFNDIDTTRYIQSRSPYLENSKT